jgi:hypothetical protein
MAKQVPLLEHGEAKQSFTFNCFAALDEFDKVQFIIEEEPGAVVLELPGQSQQKSVALSDW